eukprot:TRINITY_DN3941_c0_g1_i1.p1 TRINITY_DN3941_c0_g1~~TRINITY_DN3941_c0_g1_i1.p1  ORF type:complete len:367 (+),score=113.86 TRINITY_DN3941_c0_g1_i1:58-1158(+)
MARAGCWTHSHQNGTSGELGHAGTRDTPPHAARYREKCINAILARVAQGACTPEDVLRESLRAEEENRILPEIACAERFLKNVERTQPMLDGGRPCPAAEQVAREARERLACLQIEIGVQGGDTTDATTTSLSDYDDTDSEDDGAPPEALTLHLNPELPISEAEYAAWLRMMQCLRSTHSLTTSADPRRLLLLMSSVFTPAVALDAFDALRCLHHRFRDEWFTRDMHRAIRCIVCRALGLLGVQGQVGDRGSASVRKMRLKQRRKVFKARKRIWDHERRTREGLEEEFVVMMSTLHSDVATMKSLLDPSWFTALVQEHHASLEEQMARSLLEGEYADMLAQITELSGREPRWAGPVRGAGGFPGVA